MGMSLSPLAPENFVARNEFGRSVPRNHAHLIVEERHTSASEGVPSVLVTERERSGEIITTTVFLPASKVCAWRLCVYGV